MVVYFKESLCITGGTFFLLSTVIVWCHSLYFFSEYLLLPDMYMFMNVCPCMLQGVPIYLWLEKKLGVNKCEASGS